MHHRPELGTSSEENSLFIEQTLERVNAAASEKIIETTKALIKEKVDFLKWCKNNEEFFYLFMDYPKFIPNKSPLKNLSSEEIKTLYGIIYGKDMDDILLKKLFPKQS